MLGVPRLSHKIGVSPLWSLVTLFVPEVSFLKDVSQKSFVFEFRSFIFEGSLAEKLHFRASKLHFWRKSRRKARFLSFEASFLKEVSQKSFVLELRSSMLSIYPSIDLSIYLSIYLSIHLSIYLSIYLSISLSIYLCIYVSLSVFFISHLGSWLRIRRFSELTCRLSGATKHWKTLPFGSSASSVFWLVLFSDLLSSTKMETMVGWHARGGKFKQRSRMETMD